MREWYTSAAWRQFVTERFWRQFWRGLSDILDAALRAACRRLRGAPARRAPHRTGCCIDLPPSVYKRADPLIYAQYYLMAQGLAVTWDNPDIEVFDGGTPVTGKLQAGHTYRVRVRVWNGSYDAPAVGVGVQLSFLSFGVQAKSNFVAKTTINLGVKGSAHCPAFAEFTWTTPAAPGHYCLQALLAWPDDANPGNNLGQKNVDVAVCASPATFTFTVRNHTSVRQLYRLDADTYMLPDLPPCGDDRGADPGRVAGGGPPPPPPPPPPWGGGGGRGPPPRARHRRSDHPIPPTWRVAAEPAQFVLAPDEERLVTVEAEPRTAGFRGELHLNVHAFTVAGAGDADGLAGGVTLVARTPV